MAAYYNEFDPYAAQWLRNLVAAGHIAPGDVDERSIVDVHADDLIGYDQCHFFAGIGGWSLAARLAGWPDERPLWTGSCPCQPFSAAGKGEGKADQRHLWPVFFGLIRAQRPNVVMGEQVAAAVGKDWLDGVHSDLESIDYACGAAVVPACAVDAPHRRDRLWFVADAERQRADGQVKNEKGSTDEESSIERQLFSAAGTSSGGQIFMANTDSISGGQEHQDTGWCLGGSSAREIARPAGASDGALAYADGEGGRERDCGTIPGATSRHSSEASHEGNGYAAGDPRPGRENSTAWSGAEWLTGADGKARRFEPGIRLLAHGVPARVGKLRAYGNAIVPQVAAEVIGAYLDIERAAA